MAENINLDILLDIQVSLCNFHFLIVIFIFNISQVYEIKSHVYCIYFFVLPLLIVFPKAGSVGQISAVKSS